MLKFEILIETSRIIIHIRHFSGKIKTCILACSFVFSVIAAVSNHITLLPGKFATFAIFPCTTEECNIRAYCPPLSLITRMRRELAHFSRALRVL